MHNQPHGAASQFAPSAQPQELSRMMDSFFQNRQLAAPLPGIELFTMPAGILGNTLEQQLTNARVFSLLRAQVDNYYAHLRQGLSYSSAQQEEALGVQGTGSKRILAPLAKFASPSTPVLAGYVALMAKEITQTAENKAQSEGIIAPAAQTLIAKAHMPAASESPAAPSQETPLGRQSAEADFASSGSSFQPNKLFFQTLAHPATQPQLSLQAIPNITPALAKKLSAASDVLHEEANRIVYSFEVYASGNGTQPIQLAQSLFSFCEYLSFRENPQQDFLHAAPKTSKKKKRAKKIKAQQLEIALAPPMPEKAHPQAWQPPNPEKTAASHPPVFESGQLEMPSRHDHPGFLVQEMSTRQALYYYFQKNPADYKWAVSKALGISTPQFEDPSLVRQKIQQAVEKYGAGTFSECIFAHLAKKKLEEGRVQDFLSEFCIHADHASKTVYVCNRIGPRKVINSIKCTKSTGTTGS